MLAELLQYGVPPLIVSLFLGLLYRQARKPAKCDLFSGERVLTYGWPIHVLGWSGIVVCSGLTAGAVSLFFVVPQPPTLAIWFCVAIGAFFDILCVYVVAESIGSRIVISKQSITSHSPWGLPRTLQWTDIVEVSFAPWAQWFVVSGKRGETIRVSIVMSGIDDFLNEVRPLFSSADLAACERAMSHHDFSRDPKNAKPE